MYILIKTILLQVEPIERKIIAIFFPAARIWEFCLVFICGSTCTCINILIHNYSSLFNFLNYHQVMIPNLTVIHASVIRQSILLDTINRKPVMTIKYNYNRTNVEQ